MQTVEISILAVVLTVFVVLCLLVAVTVQGVGLHRLRKGIDDIFESVAEFASSVVNNFCEEDSNGKIVQKDIPRKHVMRNLEKIMEKRQKMERTGPNSNPKDFNSDSLVQEKKKQEEGNGGVCVSA